MMALRRPIHILYMEDDPGMARLVQTVLEREGYAVALAGDGEALVLQPLAGNSRDSNILAWNMDRLIERSNF